MRTDGRYVFDANVIISALLFVDSTPGRAFLHAVDHGALLVSLPLLKELQEVLSHPKFDRYLLRDERDRFLAALVREATLIEATEPVQICRDPKDNHVLELAVAGQATCIITGDQDLLVLNPFRTILILDPATFLATLVTPPEHNP